MAGSHAAFIAAAYLIAALLLVGAITVIVIDYRAQRRALARLEGQAEVEDGS